MVLLAVPLVILRTRRDRASSGCRTRRDGRAKNYTTCLECQVVGVVYGGSVDANQAVRGYILACSSVQRAVVYSVHPPTQPVLSPSGLLMVATLLNTLPNRLQR